jgi:hypothetical protein
MRIQYSSKATAIETDTKIIEALESISEHFLSDVVNTLSFPRHFVTEPRNNRLAAEWITKQLQSYGYHTFYQGEFANVVAFPSEKIQDNSILIGAHYDSKPGTPGADDNASAIAALLGCAKAIAEYTKDPSMCFVSFNREEDSMIGSADFVDNYLLKNGIHICQAHILEMVGYCSHSPKSQRKPLGLPVAIPQKGNFLGLIGNKHSNTLVAHLLQQAKSYLPDFPVLGLQMYFGLERLFYQLLRSDHVPFWRRGLSALMWTDTANFRNPNYHRMTDTPDTLDYTFLRRVTQLLILQCLLTQRDGLHL